MRRAEPRRRPPDATGGVAVRSQLSTLEQALAADFAVGSRAEEVFLAWLLELPEAIDPALAATAVLARVESFAGAREGELGRLRDLLEETMSWPRPVIEVRALSRRPDFRRLL